MRVLVTGGTGFVGRAVARELVRSGHEVTILTRRLLSNSPDEAASPSMRTALSAGTYLPSSASVAEGLPVANAIVVSGSLACAETMDQLIGQYEFSGICHLAGLSGIQDSFIRPVLYFDTNVGNAVNLLNAVRSRWTQTGCPVRIVFASSRAVYAQAKDELVPETHPATPASPYGVTKRAVEQLLAFESRLGSIGASVLRCFNVSGADRGIVDNQPRLIPRLIGSITGLFPPTPLGSLRNRRDFVHVLDVGRAFVAALEAVQPSQYRVYNVGSGEGTSVERVIAYLEETARCSVPRLPVPDKRGCGKDAGDSDAGIADISLIRRELDWNPDRNIETLVRDAWHFSTMVGNERQGDEAY